VARDSASWGPTWPGVTRRRDDDWLARWLKSPEKMLATDPQAKATLKEYNNLPMPNQNLSETEIQQYLRYFHWSAAQPTPPATRSGAGH
jgi:nitrite reductase (NO-forming)